MTAEAVLSRGDGRRGSGRKISPVGASVRANWQKHYSRWLLLFDTVVVCAAVLLAQVVRFGTSPRALLLAGLFSAGLIAVWLCALAIFRTRSARVIGAGLEEYRLVVSATVWTFGAVAIVTLLARVDVARGYLAVALPLGLLALLVTRNLRRVYVARQRAQGKYQTAVLAIGDRKAVTLLADELMRDPANGYRVVGMCVTGYDELVGDSITIDGREVPNFGDESQALAAIHLSGADTVAVTATEHLGVHGIRTLTWDLESMNIDLLVSPGVLDVAGPRLSMRPVAGFPLIHVEKPQYHGAQRFQKRAFDFCFALAAIIGTSPLLILTALAVKLTSKGPVFYAAERIGLDGKPFKMLKFRSMVDGADRQVQALDRRGAGAAGRSRDEPVARSRRAAPPEPEPERGDHDSRRPPFGTPGGPGRSAAAAEPRGERGVEPGRRACGGEQDHRALEPLVAPRRRADRPVAGRDRRARGRPDRRTPARAVLDSGLMLEGKRVAVVVPAFDEEHLVGETIRGIPAFVDRIFVVDDASRDGTAAAAMGVGDGRVEVLGHERNAGVGAAIATGYRRAREEGIDVTCVMAADNQMDPVELEALVAPVARAEVEYAKANRLVSGEAWTVIPRTRYLGNAVLSLLTKIASGYWHIADSQAGYTALSLDALRRLDLDRLYPRYGFPNDMLVHLNVQNARVRDVPSRPIYDVGERSGIRLRSVIPRISWLLFKGFWWRMGQKYVIRDFHPLVFFYAFGALMLGVGLVLGLLELILRIAGNAITPATIVLVAVLVIAGLQMTLFAMWFDMEANKDLR